MRIKKNSLVKDLRFLRDRERDLKAGVEPCGREFPFYHYLELKKAGLITATRINRMSMFILSSYAFLALLTSGLIFSLFSCSYCARAT